MRALFFLLIARYSARALPATQASSLLACTRDALFTSLFRDGRHFCASVVSDRCGKGSTPTQFATYDPDVLYSHCSCVLRETCRPRTTTVSLVSVNATETVPVSTSGFSGTQSSATFTNTGTGASRTSSTWLTTSSHSVYHTATTPTSNGWNSTSTSSAPATSTTPYGNSTSATFIGTGPGSSSVELKPTTVRNNATRSSRETSGVPSVSSSSTFTISSVWFPTRSGLLSTGTGSTWTSRTTGRWNTTSAGGGHGSSVLTFSGSMTSSVTRPWTSAANATQTLSTSPTLSSVWLSTTAVSVPGNLSMSTVLATRIPANRSTELPGTPLPASSELIPSSFSFTSTSSNTSTTPTTPAFITPTGTAVPTTSFNPNATLTSVPTLPAANFTQVTRTGDLVKETCYHLPQDPLHGQSRRAMLHNADLREHNKSIPFPYVESVDFAVDGVDPLFVTLRDAAQGTHYLDVSNRSYVSLVDSLGNAVLLNGQGIHFSTNSCRYDVSLKVDSLYKQLAALSGEACSKGGLVERMHDLKFNQTLYLHDQCGHAVKQSIRKYPLLKVGDTECNDIAVDESLGKWAFDCTFPGSDSGTLRCQRAVRTGIFKFLFVDPFGGACPDLSTVITTLEATSQDFLNAESLRAELYNQGLTDAQRREVDLTVMYYEQLWEILKQALSKSRARPPATLSAVEQYIATYDELRNFEEDVCEDLHAADLPLKMSLRAGVSLVDAVARLNWAPTEPKAYNVTVQDPDSVACCAGGSRSSYEGHNGTCAYPDTALIAGTGCVCGVTASGAALAFEYTECDNFVSRCETDADCDENGHGGFACLVGSCCGGGVCVDPYACAQDGIMLVKPGP